MSPCGGFNPSFEGMPRAGIEPAQGAFTPRLNPYQIKSPVQIPHRSPSPSNTQDPSEYLVVRQEVFPPGRTTNSPRCYYATCALHIQLSLHLQERRRCHQYLPWWWIVKVHIGEIAPIIPS